MSRAPNMHELRQIAVHVPSLPKCGYCGNGYGELGVQTLAEVIRATTEHKAICPRWPSPRTRTAQCRPMAGQTAIPLPE